MLFERRRRSGSKRDAEAPGNHKAGYAVSDEKRGKEKRRKLKIEKEEAEKPGALQKL